LRNIDQQNTNKNHYLLHLDKLIVTFETLDKTIKCTSDSFSTKTFHFEHDRYLVSRLYLKVFKTYFNGIYVGVLRMKNKFNKPHIEFEFDKQVFYSFSKTFWFDVASALEREMHLKFNNIKNTEIAMDSLIQFFDIAYELHHNSTKHKGCKKPKYEQVDKGNPVSLLHDESEIIIGGSSKSVVIYNKSNHAENYIKEFFKNNGLSDTDVNRLECRFDSGYLSTFQKRHNIKVDLDSLVDDGKLSKLFLMMIKKSVEYKVLKSKRYDRNRNPHFDIKSMIDGISFETSKLEKYNSEIKLNHYKEDKSFDILKMLYYQYLEEKGFNIKILKKYAINIKISREELKLLILKFNNKYNGHKTKNIKEKMRYAEKFISAKGVEAVKLNLIQYFNKSLTYLAQE